MERENLVATVAGLAAATAMFAVMFWLVDAGAVFAAMRGADPGLLVVVAGTILLWNVSWGIALWNVLCALDVDVPIHLAILINAAGAFANHVTPFGQAGGEPVTAWLLTQTAETDYEVSLASIASLDAINVVPSLTFATAGSLYFLTVGSRGEGLGLLPVAVVTAAVVLSVIVVVGWRFRRGLRARIGAPAMGVVHRVASALPRVSVDDLDGVSDRVAGFVAAVGRIAVNRRRLSAVLAFSALGWAFQSVGLWVTFLSLESFVPLYVPFFVLPLGKVGSVVPTPGGLGGSEAINVAVLATITDAGAATIAAAVTIHSVGGYLLTTSVGAAATSALGVRE